MRFDQPPAAGDDIRRRDAEVFSDPFRARPGRVKSVEILEQGRGFVFHQPSLFCFCEMKTPARISRPPATAKTVILSCSTTAAAIIVMGGIR